MNIWDQLKQQLAARLTPESFQNWLEKTEMLGINGNQVLVKDGGTWRYFVDHASIGVPPPPHQAAGRTPGGPASLR